VKRKEEEEDFVHSIKAKRKKKIIATSDICARRN